MKLKNLLQNIDYIEILGNVEIEINNVSQDTREVFTQSTAYFAVTGTQIDGHLFINQAIQKGARVIFCEQIPEKISKNITYVILESVISRS